MGKKFIISNIVILFISVLIITGCGNNSNKLYKITFLVHVKNPIVNQKVYITGNQPELSNWIPGKVELNKINDSLFSRTFSFKENTELLFKVTAGSWWEQALDSSYQNYKNFIIKLKKDTDFPIIVYDWRNIFRDGKIVLNKKRFQPNRDYFVIDGYWKYHSGDNLNWSEENFDDSEWKSVTSYIDWNTDSLPEWDNVGWFRFNFIADTSLWNKSLAFLIGHLGASQVYYNGRLLYSYGKIGNSVSTFKPLQVRIWKEFVIDPKPYQVIAVRYANYNWKEQRRLGFSPGFAIYLKDINTLFEQTQNIRAASYHQMVFTIIPLILFFFHIFIFAFNPKHKENLFYAICLLGFAGITYYGFERFIETNPSIIIFYYRLNSLSVPVAIFFSLMTFYAIEYIKIPKRWILYFVIFVSLLVWNYLLLSYQGVINYTFFGIVSLDIIISSIKRWKKKDLKGQLIVNIGLAVLFAFILLQILFDYSIISPFTEFNQIFEYGMIGFAVSMSIFLSYNFSLTNKNLESQLIKVKELSEKTIEQERTANKIETEKRIIESENNRKTQELEEARKLQLSFLPKKIPEHKNLDIAVYMKTATEVGGDYYDVIEDENEHLNVIVGDATGHGVKAGIMVAIVKSLIHDLNPKMTSAECLNKINDVIISMQLGNLYMGLTFLKFNDSSINIASAGMPSTLLYHKNENRIEEIVFKRMPLGATNKLDFEQRDIKILQGDALLILSDGLLELFNEKREMFELTRVKEILLKNNFMNSSEIISELKIAGENWRNGFEQLDDMTLVVVKHK